MRIISYILIGIISLVTIATLCFSQTDFVFMQVEKACSLYEFCRDQIGRIDIITQDTVKYNNGNRTEFIKEELLQIPYPMTIVKPIEDADFAAAELYTCDEIAAKHEITVWYLKQTNPGIKCK